jgi:hypothetical protein
MFAALIVSAALLASPPAAGGRAMAHNASGGTNWSHVAPNTYGQTGAFQSGKW